MQATLIIYTKSQDKVYRKLAVDPWIALDAAMAVHERVPGLILGLFEDEAGESGEAMFFFPDETLMFS